MAKIKGLDIRASALQISGSLAARGRVIRGQQWGGELNQLLRNPPADISGWMERHTVVVKSDTDSMAGLLQVKDMPCFLKLYRSQSRFRRAWFVLGGGRPRRSYRAARALAGHGAPVPCPYSLLLVPEGVLLLTEGFEGTRNLDELWQQSPSVEEARHLMRCAGETFAYLHKAGYTHGDCKWANLLWSDGQFLLVDLDAARKPRLGISWRQARDIARFTVNAEEMALDTALYEQFLESYLQLVCQPRDLLVQRMMRYLRKFRARHLARYGIRGQQLL